MKKLIVILISILLTASLVLASECQPVMQPGEAVNCSITSLWSYGNCANYHLIVYNASGNYTSNFTYYNITPSTFCQTMWNITTIGSYTGVVENGDTVSIEIQGDKQMMSFTVISFLIVFNLGIFLFPFFVKQLSQNKATDYILKNLIFMGGILFLWLNVTILRQMASDSGLGIDNLLEGVWWFVTCLIVIVIFAMCYTTLIGYLQMLKESEMRKRMGDE